MTDAMVEKVAAAIWNVTSDESFANMPGGSGSKLVCLDEARAAIAATGVEEMREALALAETWMHRITDEVLDGEGVRANYVTACEQIRAALTTTREETK